MPQDEQDQMARIEGTNNDPRVDYLWHTSRDASHQPNADNIDPLLMTIFTREVLPEKGTLLLLLPYNSYYLYYFSITSIP